MYGRYELYREAMCTEVTKGSSCKVNFTSTTHKAHTDESKQQVCSAKTIDVMHKQQTQLGHVAHLQALVPDKLLRPPVEQAEQPQSQSQEAPVSEEQRQSEWQQTAARVSQPGLPAPEAAAGIPAAAAAPAAVWEAVAAQADIAVLAPDAVLASVAVLAPDAVLASVAVLAPVAALAPGAAVSPSEAPAGQTEKVGQRRRAPFLQQPTKHHESATLPLVQLTCTAPDNGFGCQRTHNLSENDITGLWAKGLLGRMLARNLSSHLQVLAWL